MSNEIRTVPTAVGVFQSHFGSPPGTLDAKKECENWQRLCDELLAERARLKAELEHRRLMEFINEPIPNLTMEEVYAQVDRTTTLEHLIEEIERDAEKEA